MRNQPRLSWVNAKTHAGLSDRKHQPGRKPEHVAALAIDDARGFVAAVRERIKTNDTGKDLPDHQEQMPIVAAGVTEA